MSKPYSTPIQLSAKNTPWQGQNYQQMSLAFEKAFVLTTICAWCKRWMSGPERNTPDKISHGLCKECLKKQVL